MSLTAMYSSKNLICYCQTTISVLTITNNNPIDNAKKATILNDIATLKDGIEQMIMNEIEEVKEVKNINDDKN